MQVEVSKERKIYTPHMGKQNVHIMFLTLYSPVALPSPSTLNIAEAGMSQSAVVTPYQLINSFS